MLALKAKGKITYNSDTNDGNISIYFLYKHTCVYNPLNKINKYIYIIIDIIKNLIASSTSFQCF